MKKWGIALILFALHAIVLAIIIGAKFTPYPSFFILLAFFVASIGFCVYSLIKKEGKVVSITLLVIMLIEFLIFSSQKVY